MQKNHRLRFSIIAAIASIAAGAWWAVGSGRPPGMDVEMVPRPPRISPDYAGIVLPPNVAPLNFAVREEGERFFARISGEAGEPVEIVSRSRAIAIPPGHWRALLDCNRGRDLRWEVYAELHGQWRRYHTLINRVAEDEIDPYLVYRLIPPVFNTWNEVGIYQRSLATSKESVVLDGKSLGSACVNCHAFSGNDPQRMLIAMRSDSLGKATILADEGRVAKLDTALGYTAWHPSGRMAAYSTNKVRQVFHTAGPEVRDVIDLESSLAYVRIASLESKQVPGASDEGQLATYPAWSPDGRWLYYCRAPLLWTDRDAVPPERYAEVRYDLMRMAYDLETDQWGDPQTVLSSNETGLSILLPRVSPDGRFLMFCMCGYGCFPAFQPTSDLYLMDLQKGTYEKPPINSEASESWHSWSSNSRWVAFSSKRGSGVFTRCYLSYIDETGRAHKPLVVPQADPEFYESFVKTISVPELLRGPVGVSPSALRRAANSDDAVPVAAARGGRSQVDDSEPYRQAVP
ncbi:MAG: hypothetical protein GXY83_14705 [Rhodopirellula sp.]|nr:hypothetical protein [Rhodopirellula sp.]